MKSIYWKELRENAKWALIGLLLFATELTYAWVSILRKNEHTISGGDVAQSICHPVFQSLLLFTPIVMAGVLCGLQIKLERWRDRWAFLVHRPVPLISIFWGKALAGTTLYLAAMLIPYLGLCWWASVPGHCPAPFHWGMTIGGFLNILNGLIVYYAGLLGQMRPARMIGSRLVPLFAVVYLMRFANDAHDWQPVLAWELVALVVVALAAAGSFTLLDRTTRCRWILSTALLITLYVGFMEVLLWPMDIYRVFRSYDRGDEYYVYSLLDDGQVVLEHHLNFGGTISDLNGKVIASTREDFEKFEKRILNMYGVTGKDLWALPEYHYTFREGGHWIGKPYRSFRSGEEWFYDNRGGYFIRYTYPNTIPDGYLFADGFSTTAPHGNNRFPHVPWTLEMGYMRDFPALFDTQLYWIDIVKYTAKPIFSTPDQDDLFGFIYIDNSMTDEDEKKFVVAITLDEPALHILTIDGKELFHSAWHKDRNIYKYISIGTTKDSGRFYFEYFPDDETRTIPYYMIETDRSGNVLKETKLPRLFHPKEVRSWFNFWDQKSVYLSGNTSSEIKMVASLWWQARHGDKPAQDWWKKFKTDPKETLADMAICFAIGIACAAIACRRMGNYSFSALRKRLWTALIVFTGPTGLLTLLAFEEWPASEPCPSCNKRHLITREHCEHCGALWPEPARDGTEIVTVE